MWGVFIGIDWYSKDHDAYKNKDGLTQIIDESTLEFNSGWFANLGAIHFFDVEEIKNLLADFEIILLEKIKQINMLNEEKTAVSFNVIARKIKKDSNS